MPNRNKDDTITFINNLESSTTGPLIYNANNTYVPRNYIVDIVGHPTFSNLTVRNNLDVSSISVSSLIINGELDVKGTTTSINTINLDISDNLISLNNGLTGNPLNDSGILIYRGDASNAFMGWDELNQKFLLGTTDDSSTDIGTLDITPANLNVKDLDVSGTLTGPTITRLDSSMTTVFNDVSPTGSITAYMGTTSPLGWIICDGGSISNTDGKYNALLNMGIGTGTLDTGNYSPPNLKGRFLYGANDSMPIHNTGGNSNITLSIDNMPSHNHDISSSQMEHSHTYQASGSKEWTDLGNDKSVARDDHHLERNTSAVAPKITSESTPVGGDASFNILPPYYIVNYILKY